VILTPWYIKVSGDSDAFKVCGITTGRRTKPGNRFGLDLDEWIARAEDLATAPPDNPTPCDVPVTRVFDFRIEPTADPSSRGGG
jgi:hypothetical protein